MICALDNKPNIRAEIQNLADKIGADYNTAKIIYENNNGYSLDKAPNGAESKLYKDLLDHYESDENKALIAKAKTYLQPFFNWFGNWTDPDATNVSKVVDENGEPLVVYHATKSVFDTFDHSFAGSGSGNYENTSGSFYFAKHKETALDVFHTKTKEEYDSYQVMPVFLNIKNPNNVPLEIFNKTWFDKENFESLKTGDGIIAFPKKTPELIFEEKLSEYNIKKELGKLSMFDRKPESPIEFMEEQLDHTYVTFDPNQIKSIENQGTFSNTDDNIYHNKKLVSIENKFKNDGLIHWFERGKRWMITKLNYNTPEQLQSLIDRIDFESKKLGYNADFTYTRKGIAVTFASDELYDRLPKSPEYQNVRKLITFLSQRFPGLEFGGIVSQKLVPSNQNAFVKNGKIYLVEGRFTDQIAIEECLHPFVNALYQENPELFNALFNEAEKEYAKLWQQIRTSYDNSQYDLKQELVAQALSREFKKEYTQNKPSKFRELVNGFVEWLKGLFESFIGTDDIAIIDVKQLPRMSLLEISKLINTSDTIFGIDYSGKFNSISTSRLDKTNEKLKKGIKQRLATIQRYQTKNVEVIRETQRLIDKLNHLDSIEGTVEFVNFVRDNITDAFKFLNNSYDDINSTQIVQLKRDYLGFFIPMMNDIKMVMDTTDELKDIPDYDLFKLTVNGIVSGQVTLMNTYQNILNQKTRDLLVNYATEAGSQTVDQLINWLEDPNKDLNWFDEFLGLNSSTGNEVFRIMTDMLNNSVALTKRNTYQEGVKLVNLLKKAKESNKGIDVMSLLQEKDKNGQTTGYFVRNLNYGLFYQDLQKEYDKIATDMQLERDSDGEIMFKDKEQEREFRKRRINAQLKYGNLKYTKEYYAEKAKLPVEAQDALDYINSEIDYFIKSISTRGVIRWDKLSAEKKAHLDNLYRQKAELYNEYYADGEAKSGIDLVIAQSLQKMRKALKGKVKYKPDYVKFNESAKYIISKYGSDSELYKKWVESATDIVFTDEFYDYLDSVSMPKSKKVRELTEERNRLLDMYRDQGTRAIEMPIPDEIKAKIIEIDKEIASRKGTKLDTDFKFSDIAEMRKTKQYYEDERKAKEEGNYEEWYHKNHYEVNGRLRVASYYTYLYPKKDKFITRQPNRFYSLIDQDSEYVNSEYDLNGEYVQPKKSLYDNSAAYNKVANNPTIKALYDALIDKMTESNGKITFAQNQNPYRLPQISGRMMATIARSDNKWEALKYVVADQFKIKDDDTEYVDSFEQRPDGSKIKLIPTRFMKMLDDPKMITSDVVGSVIQYFEMAENYKNMSAIQNDLEMTLYHIEGLKVTAGDELKQGNNTRLYKKMVTLLDMNLYGKKKDKTTVKGYNLSKSLTKLFNYISLSNLAYNPWAITAGYVTGQGTLDIESIAGKYFDIDDILFAKTEFAKRLGHITANIGNVNDKDKLMMMMQINQVVRSNQETFDRLDQSAALRGINQHFWYNGYTMGDFTVKSQLLMATYHGYKYVDGEYITQEQYIARYYPEDRKAGKKHFKAIVGTLWDAYDVVDGELKIVVSGALKKAAEAVQNKVMNKINTLAVRIDGNITDTDRTLIHQNAITLFLAMHRNFLISGLQERLKSKQFNYSTGLMEGGMYSDAVKFIGNLLKNHHITFLTHILSDYNNLDELEKYNVRKVYMDLMNIAVWSMLISTLFVAAADDDPDNYYLQALAYASTRISFEFRTLYNPLEVTNLFNSPSAAVSTLENAFNYIKLVFPGTYFYESNMFSEIKSGVYKGWPKILRNTVKLTPLKNIIEATDVKGIRGKRNYLENQMMF